MLHLSNIVVAVQIIVNQSIVVFLQGLKKDFVYRESTHFQTIVCQMRGSFSLDVNKKVVLRA